MTKQRSPPKKLTLLARWSYRVPTYHFQDASKTVLLVLNLDHARHSCFLLRSGLYLTF